MDCRAYPAAGSRILVSGRSLGPVSSAVPLPSLWPVRTVVGRGLNMDEIEREHPLYLNKPWTRQKVRKILRSLAVRSVYRASFRTV